MATPVNFQRFIDAQRTVYDTALQEIRDGRKKSHWIWFIFPQVAGLGLSETSIFYAIKDLREAAAYLQDPILGVRLVEISRALLQVDGKSVDKIFGSPDDMKLKSSMTLFSLVPQSDPVFIAVLQKYFKGLPDHSTLRIIEKTT
jgi:uncharacterized protein (DUF1810 family)